jgi:hypothetical protein
MFKTLNSVDGAETIHIGTDHKKKAATETTGGLLSTAAFTDLKYLNDKMGTPAELLREFVFAAVSSSDLAFLGKVMMVASAQGFNMESLIGGTAAFAALVGLLSGKINSGPSTKRFRSVQVLPAHVTALPVEAAWTHDNGYTFTLFVFSTFPFTRTATPIKQTTRFLVKISAPACKPGKHPDLFPPPPPPPPP